LNLLGAFDLPQRRLFAGQFARVKRDGLASGGTAQQRQIITQQGWPNAPESVTESDWNEEPRQIEIEGWKGPEGASPWWNWPSLRSSGKPRHRL
jgi:hypothetical protein